MIPDQWKLRPGYWKFALILALFIISNSLFYLLGYHTSTQDAIEWYSQFIILPRSILET